MTAKFTSFWQELLPLCTVDYLVQVSDIYEDATVNPNSWQCLLRQKMADRMSRPTQISTSLVYRE